MSHPALLVRGLSPCSCNSSLFTDASQRWCGCVLEQLWGHKLHFWDQFKAEFFSYPRVTRHVHQFVTIYVAVSFHHAFESLKESGWCIVGFPSCAFGYRLYHVTHVLWSYLTAWGYKRLQRAIDVTLGDRCQRRYLRRSLCLECIPVSRLEVFLLLLWLFVVLLWLLGKMLAWWGLL